MIIGSYTKTTSLPSPYSETKQKEFFLIKFKGLSGCQGFQGCSLGIGPERLFRSLVRLPNFAKRCWNRTYEKIICHVNYVLVRLARKHWGIAAKSMISSEEILKRLAILEGILPVAALSCSMLERRGRARDTQGAAPFIIILFLPVQSEAITPDCQRMLLNSQYLLRRFSEGPASDAFMHRFFLIAFDNLRKIEDDDSKSNYHSLGMGPERLFRSLVRLPNFAKRCWNRTYEKIICHVNYVMISCIHIDIISKGYLSSINEYFYDRTTNKIILNTNNKLMVKQHLLEQRTLLH
ncbi:hypothetical protein ACJX0J_039225, partial [Zea mays]